MKEYVEQCLYCGHYFAGRANTEKNYVFLLGKYFGHRLVCAARFFESEQYKKMQKEKEVSNVRCNEQDM